VTSPDAEPLIVYPSRDRFRFLMQVGAGLLLMCGVGLALVTSVSIPRPFKVIATAVLVLSTLFFLFCLTLAVSRFLTNKPMLILDRAGLTDQSSLGAAGFVPWSELSNVRFTEYCGQVLLAVDTTHPEQFIAERGNLMWRLAKRFNLKRGLGVVTLSAPALGISGSELAETIEAQISQARPSGV
jgi:hypothetical protein